jgi:hypothetical protein
LILGYARGQSDARPAGAASHVQDPRRRFGPKPHVDVDNRRKPFSAKQIDEPGPVGLRPALGLPWQGRRRVPNPKRLHHPWKSATGADDVDARVSLVSDIGPICQDGDVLRRQPIPASQWVRPAGRRPRAAHSRRGAQATPAHTVQWFQCVRPAATRWPHRLLRVPDTARVVHQDNGVELQRPHSIVQQPLPQRLRPVNSGPRIPGSTSPSERLRSALAHPLHLPPVRITKPSSWNRLSSHGPNPSQVAAPGLQDHRDAREAIAALAISSNFAISAR